MAACDDVCGNKNVNYKIVCKFRCSQKLFMMRNYTLPQNQRPMIFILSKCETYEESFYKCACMPNHIVIINTQFDAFMECTLKEYRTGNITKLEDEEYFITFVFFLKYFPKGATFYLRWLFNLNMLQFEANQYTPGGYEPLESSSIKWNGKLISKIKLLLRNESFFIHDTTECFNKLFKIFNWSDRSSNLFPFFNSHFYTSSCCEDSIKWGKLKNQ